MNIGIHTVSSQSGRAFLVDMVESGCNVYGYARESAHGIEFVQTINLQNGINLERPKNNINREESKLIQLSDSSVGHDMEKLVTQSDIIIISQPSHFLVETIRELYKAGITKRRIPLVLSPPRTFAVPYLWNILGFKYPIVCFSTCPYSCKAINSGTVYIKRRKRNWLTSLEGEFQKTQIEMLKKLFPQAVFNSLPATTSIGNIGAVFHPGAYLLNYEKILLAEKEGREFSFYVEGIANNAEVAACLEAVDQVRLQIADYLGLQVFGLRSNPNDKKWFELMNSLRDKEKQFGNNIRELRKIRRDHLIEINEAITSAQHWLDYTYGVERIPGESLQDAIARTPTYQKRSVPQQRYIDEDIPTGLIPLLAIADRFNIDVTPIQDLINIYDSLFLNTDKSSWRYLKGFSTEFIYDYLQGKYFDVV